MMFLPLGLLADGETAVVVRISGKKEEHEAGKKESCHACGGKQSVGKSCQPGVASAAEAGSHEACAHGGKNRIGEMGLRTGKNVEMLKNPGRGPLLLKVEEARIAIGRAMAMRIFVRRKEKNA